MPRRICEAVIAAVPVTWTDLLSDPVKAGQMLANAGILLGAITAAATLVLIGLRTYRSQLDQQFRDVYAYFWDNEKVAQGRDLISYNSEYDKIRVTLARMATAESTDQLAYTLEERQMMEAINCFCASLSKVDFLGAARMGRRRRKAFDNMFGYWIAEVRQRTELDAYFSRYWTTPIGLKKGTVSTS